MDFRRIDIRQDRRYVIPFLCRSFLCTSILCRTICAFLIKYRLSVVEFDQLRFVYFFSFRFTGVKYFRTETAVDITNDRAIDFCIEIVEIVFKFFLKQSLRERIRNFSILAVRTIHLPRCFQSRPIVFRKDMIRINHKIVEVVRRTHHHCRNIIIISARVTQIYFLAIICNGTKFETNLLSNSSVLFCTQLVPRRSDVNQSSKQTRLCIRYFNRFVRSHEQETLEPIRICRLKFLVDRHLLVGHKAVQPRVVLDF